MQLTRSRIVLLGDSASPSHVWTDKEIAGLLSSVGLGLDRFKTLRSIFGKLNANMQKEVSISGKIDSEPKNSSHKHISASSLHLLTTIFTLLNFLYNDDMRRLADYRVVLMEVTDYQRISEDGNSVTNDSWLSTVKSKGRLVESRCLSLNFWCLNPAVCMSHLAASSHCLILTSGTLAPLDALAAELGIGFPVRLEASHVVTSDRLFVASISHGPTGRRICATYTNQSSYLFQDELGSLVLEACRTVPGGVLCFLSSYGLLHKLVQRWETTGIMGQLGKIKYLFQEPRSSVNFDAWLSEFYEAIRITQITKHSVGSDCPPLLQTGAIVFAVYRGKVSEGLDFADSHGRLVISVGIPFPAFKTPRVELKRAFNDGLRASLTTRCLQSSTLTNLSSEGMITNACPVLSGTEWYEAQAYRALNQALGRCIRHRNDWAAILLVDARFSEQPTRYIAGLSRWIRKQLRPFVDWPLLSGQLSEFAVKASLRDLDNCV